MVMGNKFLDITGQRYGMLVAISFVERSNGQSRWKFKCDCKNIVIVNLSDVRRAKCTTSCGCYRKKVFNNLIHGQSNSRTYRSWSSMMTRCYNRKKSNYKSYGCRGVTVCERWHKFENFYADMGDRQPGTSLDRHPSSSMVYCKENCRWATVSQQNLNRSGKRLSSSKYKGVSFCKSNNNWRVTVTINKKPVAIGRFKNEKEAAQSYDKKAFELWGTDAYLNFPMEIMK